MSEIKHLAIKNLKKIIPKIQNPAKSKFRKIKISKYQNLEIQMAEAEYQSQHQISKISKNISIRRVPCRPQWSSSNLIFAV